MFSTADLNEDSKTPWPEESEVRDEDINKWGWGDEDTPVADNKDPAQTDASEASTPAVATPGNVPKSTPKNHERAQVQQGPRLSQIEKQNLQQVNQRNAELAALMTRVRLEELRQRPRQISQRGAHQQSFGAPHPAGQAHSHSILFLDSLYLLTEASFGQLPCGGPVCHSPQLRHALRTASCQGTFCFLPIQSSQVRVATAFGKHSMH